jgi:uncharacterized protein YndB with AHSA1/START domain
MPSIKRIQLSEFIATPAAIVFDTMTGAESYRQWTSAFTEGSYFEGSWMQGQRIRFLYPGGGIVAEVAEHRANAYISIKHLGLIVHGVEDTQSESVRAWAPLFENYTFVTVAGGTRLEIAQDVTAELETFMQQAWPKALARLKALCEAGSAAQLRQPPT